MCSEGRGKWRRKANRPYAYSPQGIRVTRTDPLPHVNNNTYANSSRTHSAFCREGKITLLLL